MASTSLVRELLFRVSDQLQDITIQFERWSQRSLVDYLNDGQRAIAKFLPSSCSRVDAIKLVPGTKQSIAVVAADHILPGDGSTAVEMRGNRLLSAPIRSMGADGMTPGRALRAVERAVLDQSLPYWHQSVGSEITQIVYDPLTPKVFFVCPGVKATGTAWIEIPWLPDPLEISQSGDYSAAGTDATKLSIDDKNVDDLANYVIARAYMKDAEYEGSLQLAATFAGQFASSINTQAVAAGLPNPKLQGLPQVAPQGN